MIEGLSAQTIALVVNVLGLPGMVFIIWYVDQQRLQRVMTQYKDDMARVVRMYEDNVVLVKGYEKLAGELAGIIQLNTQVQTRLVEQIANNTYCPMLRREGNR